jgi:multidrug resistance protein, MATE family
VWRKQSIKEAIQMPDKDCLKEWRPYFALSIPTTAMICAEWWYFELLTLTAGYLGVNEQAIMVILINLGGFMWMLAMGF